MAEFEYWKVNDKNNAGGVFNTPSGSNPGSLIDPSELPTWNAFTTDMDPDAVSPMARANALKSSSEIDEKYNSDIGDNYSFTNTSSSGSGDVVDPQMKALMEERNESVKKVKDAQTKYNNIVNDKHTAEIEQAKTLCDEKQQAYLTAVEESTNPFIQALKSQILDTENEITSTETFIKDYETDIAKTETDIAGVNSAINAQDAKISAYQSRIDALRGSLNSASDESEKSRIKANISALQAQKGHEDAQKTTLTTTKASLEAKKDELEAEKTKAKEKLVALERDKAELDNQVKKIFDVTVRNALAEYDTARRNYHTLIEQIKEEKQQALNDLQSAREELAAVDEKVAKREAELVQEKLKEQAEEALRSGESPHAVTGNNSGYDNQASREVPVEQLRTNVNDAKTELSAKETELFNIYDGKSEELNKLKTAKDNNFDAFYEVLISNDKPYLANEIRKMKQNVDRLEGVYLSKAKAVAEFESKLGLATGDNNVLVEKISGLLSAQQLLNNTDRSALDSEKQTELDNLINSLNGELSSLQNEKGQMDAVINDAQTLARLREERDKAKEEYENADAALVANMKSIIEANPEIEGLSEHVDNFVTSNTEYTTQLASQTEALGDDIISLRSRVSSLSQTLGVAEGRALANKYRFSDGSGGAIVDRARSYLGLREGDGSADIFWQKLGMSSWSSRSMPWCAAFVSSVLLDCGVDMSGAYKNSVSGLMAWGKSKGAFIEGASASPSNVKPGDVVIWKGGYFASHTGIVSAVYPDGSYDTIEGNSSNAVNERKGNGTTGKYKMSRTTGFVSV